MATIVDGPLYTEFMPGVSLLPIQPSAPPKQIIVMRTDLNMRRGKQIAQGSHAAMMFMSDIIAGKSFLTEPQAEWLEGKFTKVVVRALTERELLHIMAAAESAGLSVYPVIDSGLTEFHGVPTLTCCAIGPDYPERLDPVTGHLQLL